MMIDLPVQFSGTKEEIEANFATHQFTGGDDPGCLVCDCKPWHAAANYPCGVEPPRTLTEF